jgi:geranylgeranyl pyrophosphate synthase
VSSRVFQHYAPFNDQVFRKVIEISDTAPAALHSVLSYHLSGMAKSKGFRPALVRACAIAAGRKLDAETLLRRAAIVQLYHEMTLLIDDIFDHTRSRRGQAAAHCRYGTVVAYCAAAWAKDVCFLLEKSDPEAIEALCLCTSELANAEAFQWSSRHRPRPYSVADWEMIARGDTGAIFRLAAALAGYDADSPALHAMWTVYHGIDDVQDLLNSGALGSNQNEDIRDGIPTLPNCFTADPSKEGLLGALAASVEYLKGALRSGRLGCHTAFVPFFDDLEEFIREAEGSLVKAAA